MVRRSVGLDEGVKTCGDLDNLSDPLGNFATATTRSPALEISAPSVRMLLAGPRFNGSTNHKLTAARDVITRSPGLSCPALRGEQPAVSIASSAPRRWLLVLESCVPDPRFCNALLKTR